MTNSIADTNSSSDIDSFLDSVWMEQGLAKNTLSAYRSDLKTLEKLRPSFYEASISTAVIESAHQSLFSDNKWQVIQY